ncbi:hypothetical protein [Jidongwangia harbinensis]|uniref:hypothetical protein n=1 Tax=Jidongwangia harbinensis TaxID=2878561 RepID=UPI001CD98386|nr:hypothetical protein [Jidongwangia harbinensis]MCA2216345.1 hypothetical protein [Jidongwangia harbinensis]MCA2217080.1 hypothetical protein [Jidongwangia harbinensis]
MSDGSMIVIDDRFPGWRARIVVDEDASQPWGDALAPALLIQRRQAVWAGEVYQPKHADRVLAAWRRFGTDELFERYLRLVHGTTAIRHVTGQDLTVVIFDTANFRAHAGITDVCDLTGEHDEWRAWLDGDVYGVIVEQHTAADGWTGHDSLFGLYGNAYAEQQAAAMLTTATAALTPAT